MSAHRTTDEPPEEEFQRALRRHEERNALARAVEAHYNRPPAADPKEPRR